MSPENLSEDQQPDSEEIQRHADLTNDLLNIRAEAAQEADYDPQPMPEAGPEAGPERDQIFEQASAERGGFLRDTLTSSLVSNGLDLVPFVGGGKMLVESIAGQTLNGEEMTGKNRIIHAAMGAGSLGLDLTGIGEARESAMLAGKSVGLVGKLAAKLTERGAVKSGRIFEISAAFMAAHPDLTAEAERAAESQIKHQISNIKSYRLRNQPLDNAEAA